jgi:hypothetical protein
MQCYDEIIQVLLIGANAIITLIALGYAHCTASSN